MKKTFREKMIFGCRRAVLKHKWLKMPATIYMAVVMAFYHMGLHIASNARRYSCAVLLLCFFFVSSSFSFPGALAADGEKVETIPENEVALAAELEIDSFEVASIEEEDILTAEEFRDLAPVNEDEEETYTLDEILESNRKYEEELSRAQEDDGEEDYADYEFDPNDWRLILVNKQHTIPEDYEFPMGTITGNMRCDERILEDLLTMMQAAKADGVGLVICSPYRDFKQQTYLFNRKVGRYMDAGLSYMDAYKIASRTTTSPNASEHQIGLAIDFYGSTYRSLDEGFANTDAGIWLREHSHEYGFILRYPKGSEYITGIAYEPWHFRYVGVEAATVITHEGITLEEFWEENF